MSTAASWSEPLPSAPLDAASRLLGAELSAGGVTIRITEVEAYAGVDDAGSHAARGPTRRNASMFGPAGHLYCYFTYGMHVCANVVCGPEGTAGAVLIRAGAVVAGHSAARERRPKAGDRDLARGPARLCRALALSLADDGACLAGSREDGDPGPTLRLGPPVLEAAISHGPRVGLRLAAQRQWRLWLTGERTVSAYRPHPEVRARLAESAAPGGPTAL